MIRIDYWNGLTISALSRKYKLSRKTIRKKIGTISPIFQHPPVPILKRELEKEAIRLHYLGYSTLQICEELFLLKRSLVLTIKKHNLKPNMKDICNILECHDEKLTPYRISQKIGFSLLTIKGVLIKQGRKITNTTPSTKKNKHKINPYWLKRGNISHIPATIWH